MTNFVHNPPRGQPNNSPSAIISNTNISTTRSYPTYPGSIFRLRCLVWYPIPHKMYLASLVNLQARQVGISDALNRSCHTRLSSNGTSTMVECGSLRNLSARRKRISGRVRRRRQEVLDVHLAILTMVPSKSKLPTAHSPLNRAFRTHPFAQTRPV